MKIRIRKGMLFTLILLSVGIIGGVLFFPVNFDNQYTCLYHRIFAPEHRYQFSNHMMSPGSPVENQQNEINEMAHSELVTKYILPFGLIWWISLTVIAFGFFWLRHERKIKENPENYKG